MCEEVLTGNLVFIKLYYVLQLLICISDYSFSIKYHNTLKLIVTRGWMKQSIVKSRYHMIHKNEVVLSVIKLHRLNLLSINETTSIDCLI